MGTIGFIGYFIMSITTAYVAGLIAPSTRHGALKKSDNTKGLHSTLPLLIFGLLLKFLNITLLKRLIL